jgi:TPR repeat protein
MAEAERGDSRSQVALGLMRLNGDGGLAADPVEAARLFLAAHRLGNRLGTAHLGMLYLRGRGVPRDKPWGAWMLLLAAESSVPEALLALAKMIGRGGTLPRDPALALHLYRRAAAQGSEEAALLLSAAPGGAAEARDDRLDEFQARLRLLWHDIHQEVMGYTSNRIRAAYRRYRRVGDPRPLLRLARRIVDRPADLRWSTRGLWILRRLSDAGVAEAVYRLGVVARDGKFGPPDPAGAGRLFARAAEMGHRPSQEQLRRAITLLPG